MQKEELLKLLKENLTIEYSFEWDNTVYPGQYIVVKFAGEEISRTENLRGVFN